MTVGPRPIQDVEREITEFNKKEVVADQRNIQQHQAPYQPVQKETRMPTPPQMVQMPYPVPPYARMDQAQPNFDNRQSRHDNNVPSSSEQSNMYPGYPNYYYMYPFAASNVHGHFPYFPNNVQGMPGMDPSTGANRAPNEYYGYYAPMSNQPNQPNH